MLRWFRVPPSGVLLLALCCGWAVPPVRAAAENLPEFQILTEDWVPYQFEEDGKPIGAAVDLMVLLLERVGSKQGRDDIQVLPWARAYSNLENKANTILFSTTRTPEREESFRWVGPIFRNTTYLIARKVDGIKVETPRDLGNYRIGTIIGDASELYVQRLGVNLDRVQPNTRSLYNVEKLEKGRIDLVVSGWLAFTSDVRLLGFTPDDYEPVYEVATEDVSFAFHRDTPDWVIHKFQTALEDVRAEGLAGEIMTRYRLPSL